MFPEHRQGGCLNYHPRQPVTTPDCSSGEEIFRNIQPEHPLVQLEASPSHPIAATCEKRPTPEAHWDTRCPAQDETQSYLPTVTCVTYVGSSCLSVTPEIITQTN